MFVYNLVRRSVSYSSRVCVLVVLVLLEKRWSSCSKNGRRGARKRVVVVLFERTNIRAQIVSDVHQTRIRRTSDIPVGSGGLFSCRVSERSGPDDRAEHGPHATVFPDSVAVLFPRQRGVRTGFISHIASTRCVAKAMQNISCICCQGNTGGVRVYVARSRAKTVMGGKCLWNSRAKTVMDCVFGIVV